MKDDKAGATTTTVVNVPVTMPADTTGAKTYLALGDSYTIGQSVAEADRFPVQTAGILKGQGFKFFPPEIIAQTGWTTGNLIGAIQTNPPARTSYDIVTLLIGVNNQYQHRSQQEYADEFLQLLKTAIALAGNNTKKVIVLSIPDYSVTPFANGSDRGAIAKEIDAFNAINKRIADDAGVKYLDITPASRLAAGNPLLVANDGLHPSGAQYKLWADLLAPVVQHSLE